MILKFRIEMFRLHMCIAGIILPPYSYSHIVG